MIQTLNRYILTMMLASLTACSTSVLDVNEMSAKSIGVSEDYVIGPGDVLNIFVWRNPEISVSIPVRPDGKISTPLVEDIPAIGKTPAQLARYIEGKLEKYIRTPVVTVIVTQFYGPFIKQVRIIGQAVKPQAIPYRNGMTLLDAMIAVGGLTEFAAGNRAKLIRHAEGKDMVAKVRLDDLVKDGDISANIKLQAGDIVIIPESFF